MSEEAGEAAGAFTIDYTSVRNGWVEVITGRERRRAWTTEQKLQIVAESLEAGASPIAVARRHDVGSGLLYTWRRQLVRGELGAVAQPPTPGFACVAVVPALAGAEMPSTVPPKPETGAVPPGEGASPVSLDQLENRIEIVLSSGVVVRVGATVDQGALCRVLAALVGR